ncbi:MAG: acyl carrier protein [Sphingomonadaceae bacterium]|nr:acyl carrier protein [Sphingomonadaceae bacterium]
MQWCPEGALKAKVSRVVPHEDEVRRLIAETLSVPVERVGTDASMDALPEWDSVGHVNLMMSIEQEWNLFLEVEDFAVLTSVPAILAYLARIER